MLEEIVRTKGVDVHVSTHADELRSTEVIKCEVILEQLGDLDDVLWRGGFTGRSNFTEEFLEFFRADNPFCFQSGFGNGFLQELGHFDSNTEETPLLLVLERGIVSFIRAMRKSRLDSQLRVCLQRSTATCWGRASRRREAKFP